MLVNQQQVALFTTTSFMANTCTLGIWQNPINRTIQKLKLQCCTRIRQQGLAPKSRNISKRKFNAFTVTNIKQVHNTNSYKVKIRFLIFEIHGK